MCFPFHQSEIKIVWRRMFVLGFKEPSHTEEAIVMYVSHCICEGCLTQAPQHHPFSSCACWNKLFHNKEGGGGLRVLHMYTSCLVQDAFFSYQPNNKEPTSKQPASFWAMFSRDLLHVEVGNALFIWVCYIRGRSHEWRCASLMLQQNNLARAFFWRDCASIRASGL